MVIPTMSLNLNNNDTNNINNVDNSIGFVGILFSFNSVSAEEAFYLLSRDVTFLNALNLLKWLIMTKNKNH